MKISIILLVLPLFYLELPAQSDESSDLFGELEQRDSLLFDVGFNTCDISQFESLVSDDFEFYHDQAGITNSKAEFISGIEDGLCTLPYKPRRALDEGSMTVYPLKKNGLLYGAVQMGTHRFYAEERDGSEHLTSVARFTHIWLLDQGIWKLSRAFSYDHTKREEEDNVNEDVISEDPEEGADK